MKLRETMETGKSLNLLYHAYIHTYIYGFPSGSTGKEPICQGRRPRDMGSIPRSGRFPGGRNGNPFQYSFLENPMDRGTWWATVHEVTKSWT